MNLFSISHRKIQRGNTKEFEKLFRTFYKPLCSFVFTSVKDMDLAEEIVQDLFCTYWNKRETIEIKSSLKAYLYQAARNKTLKILAHNKVVKSYEKEQIMAQTAWENPVDNLESLDFNQLIYSALNTLPTRCQTIFYMSRNDEMSYREIGEKLSISIKTVESDMGKVLSVLREKIFRYNNPEKRNIQ